MEIYGQSMFSRDSRGLKHACLGFKCAKNMDSLCFSGANYACLGLPEVVRWKGGVDWNFHPDLELMLRIGFRISDVCLALGLSILVSLSVNAASDGTGASVAPRPNIIYIMADDMGYGDAKSFGLQRCKIPTPGIDQLASEGMRFTNAHSVSSVCVPVRMAIMTGRYPWRFNRTQPDGPWGFLNPRIPTDHHTIGKMLRSAGYTTGYIGKWHLGTKMQTKDGKNQGLNNVDFTKPLTISPLQYGFDYSYILPGSLDMYPYVFIQNGMWVGNVTKQRGWSAFNRVGPTEENFEDYKVLDTFSSEVESFIEKHSKPSKAGKPFFLYFALTAPHTPTSPHPDFQGKTRLGLYGDFVSEVDNCVVRTLAALKKHGIDQNTMVVFTSDHGPAAYAGNIKKATFDNIKGLEKMGHFPAGIFRGYKFSVYEGGLRVPYVVRWPAAVKPGQTCEQLVGLHDLMATVADVSGAELNDSQSPDSISYVNLLFDPTDSGDRQSMIMSSPLAYTIIDGNWKLLLCPGSGARGVYGNRPTSDAAWQAAVKEFGHNPKHDELLSHQFVQLFNLKDDPTESHDLSHEHPEIVESLFNIITEHWKNGRTTSGPKLANDKSGLNYWARVPKFVFGN